MTQRMTDREKAEEIGRKAVSDDYVEDGGYIRDWLVNDIAAALAQSREEGFEAAKETSAKVAEEMEWRSNAEIARMIRALRPGGKGEVK